MARIIKTRAAKPLAEGLLSRSWSKDYTSGKETFSLILQAEHTASGDARFFSLKFDRNEAFEIVKYLAPYLADPRPDNNYAKHRDAAEAAKALRDLADQIEGR